MYLKFLPQISSFPEWLQDRKNAWRLHVEDANCVKAEQVRAYLFSVSRVMIRNISLFVHKVLATNFVFPRMASVAKGKLEKRLDS